MDHELQQSQTTPMQQQQIRNIIVGLYERLSELKNTSNKSRQNQISIDNELLNSDPNLKKLFERYQNSKVKIEKLQQVSSQQTTNFYPNQTSQFPVQQQQQAQHQLYQDSEQIAVNSNFDNDMNQLKNNILKKNQRS
eukprot:TRINITY_DN42513_c0_g1_i2.p2 TRINITY_DN42513_c0_g1~~TRINITY_DN42513_c0_g1_i2.p2  ORF type:complete len:137 (+),score=18.04 TRINITY_DN42513_c0_g1_i2:410-820(+)